MQTEVYENYLSFSLSSIVLKKNIFAKMEKNNLYEVIDIEQFGSFQIFRSEPYGMNRFKIKAGRSTRLGKINFPLYPSGRIVSVDVRYKICFWFSIMNKSM